MHTPRTGLESILRRCLAMTLGAGLLASVLIAIGVPGSVLLAVAPVLVCVAMHLAMANGDADGAELFETARRSAALPPGSSRPGPVDPSGRPAGSSPHQARPA